MGMTNPITVNSTKTVTSIIRNGTAIEKMMLAWEWQPQGLFLGNIQAAWYDTVDTANDNWRRNLLTFSEQFDNAAWGYKQRILISPNAAVAPDGSMTADKLISSTVSGEKALGLSTASGLVGQIMSVYAKAAEINTLTIFNFLNGGSRGATFVLSGEGSVTSMIGGVIGTIESLPNNWYRCIARYDGFWTEGTNIRLPTGTGNDVDGLFIWGAQLELGTTATAYQRITDVNTEVSPLFPNTTIFQDSPGSAPNAVASISQTVGMWLDKSKQLALGPELVANGTFATDTDWTKTTATISDGQATLQANGSVSQAVIPLEAGRWFKITFTVVSTAGAVIVYCGTTSSADARYAAQFAAGTRTIFLQSAGALNIIRFSSNPAGVSVIDNISVKEIPGNHAIQTSTSLRPLFGRSPISRRNLLTRTEDFVNWSNTGSTTITGNQVAPNGTNTSSLLGSASGWEMRQNPTFFGTGTFSVYAKKSVGSTITVICVSQVAYRATFNFDTQQFSGIGSSIIATSYEALPDNWYRISIVGSNLALTGSNGPGIAGSAATYAYIWGPQFEAGSVATPYQKVVSALDVTEAGKPSYAFMRPDLSDDKLTTNMASTKNLLKYTEEFDNNSGWGKAGLTAVGTLITETATNTSHQLAPVSGNVIANIQHTYSFEVKPNGRSHINVSWANNGSHFAAFSLSGNGVVLSNQLSGIGTITLLADGYYRITYTNTPTIAGATFYGINLADGAYPTTPLPSYLGDVTKGVLIRKAQLEVGATATTYEYGGFKGDVVVAGKNGTAYETNVTSPTGVMDLGPLTYTGGTPGILRAVGDIVGYTMARKKFSDVEKAQLVRYYKKRGAKGILVPGPELVTNGTFNTNLSGWTLAGGYQAWVNGSIELYDLGDVSDGTATQNITMRVSGLYILSVSVIVEPGAYWLARILDGVDGGVGGTSFTGTYTSVFRSSQISNRITLLSAYPQKVRFDNVSIKEIRPEEEW